MKGQKKKTSQLRVMMHYDKESQCDRLVATTVAASGKEIATVD